MFAILGTAAIFVVLVLVVLAHVYHNGVLSETSRLSSQLNQLLEEERRLEIAFESVICMTFIEQQARDVLGMSRPDYDQVIIIENLPSDRAEVVVSAEEEGALRGFASFLSSLLEYLWRGVSGFLSAVVEYFRR